MAILSLEGRAVQPALAFAQLAAMAYRGDREPRLWVSDGVALGCVNLPTTQEAEREDLPTSDASGRYWLSWDGRLDNRDTLAHDLALKPVVARAMTDAEYVLLAYARWGDGCVHRLLGDWAIVLWDTVQRRLFCAKDPVGWRPLFYAETNRVLMVGSDPQQLTAGGLIQPIVNREYLYRYLAGAMQEPGDTCYAGIRELEGGQTLTVHGSAIAVHTYWTAPSVRQLPYRRPEEFVDEFIDVFSQATRARLRTNRRVGVCLSGGLDSSYVAAVAAQCDLEMTALTSYAPGTKWADERRYAGLVVDHLGIDQIKIDISDCWSLSSRWLPDSMFDQPFHPPQAPNIVCLAKAAHDAGIGVVLGGEGGDEWMTAGPGYISDAILRGKFVTAWRLFRRMRGDRRGVASVTRTVAKELLPLMVQDSVAHLRGKGRGSGLLPFVEPQRNWTSSSEYSRTLAWQRHRSLVRTWRLYREFAGPEVGWRERNAFVPHGIELRTPFNDLRVIELMASTPEWMKQVNGRPKDLLREAEYRVLPRAIPERSDAGLYDELMHAGVRVHEHARSLQGAETTSAFPGVDGQVALDEVTRWSEIGHPWWKPSWRVITAGLWLRSLSMSRAVDCNRMRVMHHSARREVTT